MDMSSDAMKSLSERIAERARNKEVVSPRSNRAAVLALRSDIQQAINDGWSVLAIYQTVHDEGHVTFSYQAFRRYVNRLLLGKDKDKGRRVSNSHGPKTAPPADGVRGFSFNPHADKKDLL
ncbi:TraK family protein [Paraburkholderia sp. A1RO-1]|uniref:TraK family protein n=2 Tax=Paraburkholderia TaxID=1822464 RepID=UPI003B9F5BB5